MPVKVRCRGCQKVLNAPDKARGKVIKCPACGAKLKVPGGGASNPDLFGKKKKKPAKKPRAHDDGIDFLSSLSASQLEMEDEESKVCPYCAADMDVDEIVCRECGMNTETGQMDSREAKKRARKGPDPALFYSKVWGDSWAFVMQHWRLALRTGGIWSVFMILSLTSISMISIWAPPLDEIANEQVLAEPIEGEETEEARNPMVTILFWTAMGGIFGLGVPGWYWALSRVIVDKTLNREEVKEDRIHFDMFESIALGFRAIFWPFVMMFPFLPVWTLLFVLLAGGMAILTQGNDIQFSLGILLLILSYFAIPYVVFPQAMVHMSVKHTYKAWILWEQIKILFHNFPATIYWWLVALAVYLPALIIFILLMVFSAPVQAWFFAQVHSATEWIVGDEGLFFNLMMSLIVMLAIAVVVVPYAFLMAFPALFMMRSTGLYGHYRREHLGLVMHIKPGTLVPFWVRFLCSVIDQSILYFPHQIMFAIPGLLISAKFPMAAYIGGFAVIAMGVAIVAITGAKNKNASMIGMGLGALAGVSVIFAFGMNITFFAFVFLLMSAIVPLYNSWMYYVVNEASTSRSTIGKEAFGVIVQGVDGKQETMGQATLRHVGRILSNILLGLPYLVCAFHPRKQALHDIMAKTEVVFRGDR